MPEGDPDVHHSEPLVLTVGRVNLDLYVEQQGLPMAEATKFVASVGGSPTNIAIVVQRLGVAAALLSAEGGDDTGRMVRTRLERFGVDTRWLQTIRLGVTSLALLATLEPDIGERQFYRHRPADSLLRVDVVDELPWGSLQVVVLSGDSLAQGTTPTVVQAVAREASRRGVSVWWDLDLRPSSWTDEDGRYGRVVRPSLGDADVVIGTEDEFTALLDGASPETLESGIRALGLPVVVLKLGARGAKLIRPDHQDFTLPSEAVNLVSTVGGGDSAAGGLVAGRVLGLSWEESLALAMRAAAWTVQRPYCSTGFPTAADLDMGARSGTEPRR